MSAALGWGALAASSLVLGALLGLVRPWPDRLVGLVLAFGAGALISAVSFDLAEEGVKAGGGAAVGIGLAAGALTYYGADRILERKGGGDAGPALALGAFLDGIPEQMVLGIWLASGEGVGIGLLAAIFVSNLPEAIGSATSMHASRARIVGLWIVVAIRLHDRDGCRLRDRRQRRRPLPGRRQRLRGGCAAGDADRLDDPRGAPRRAVTRPGSSPRSASRWRPR